MRGGLTWSLVTFPGAFPVCSPSILVIEGLLSAIAMGVDLVGTREALIAKLDDGEVDLISTFHGMIFAFSRSQK